MKPCLQPAHQHSVGIEEGHCIYLTIKKTLGRTMSMRALGFIYSVFFVASIIEVAFINLLIPVAM